MAGSKAGGAAKGWLDAAMAALSGGSIAFAIFAMPADIFEALVAASGLAQVTEAAQPPLGQTARLAAAGAGGLLAFLSVLLLLRSLGRPSKAKRRREVEDAELAMAPPRLRRVDAHPDAPSRRPLFAGSELGEPGAEFAPEPEDDVRDVEPQPQPAPPAWDRPMPRFLAAALEQTRAEPKEFDPEPEAWQPQPEALLEPEHEPEVGPQPEPEPAREPEPEPERQPEPEALAEAEPETWQPQPSAPLTPQSEPTISELMQRLERAIARGSHGNASAIASMPQGVNDRLRSALDDLQKIARKG